MSNDHTLPNACPRCNATVRLTPVWPSTLTSCTVCGGLLWQSANRDVIAAATYTNDDSRLSLPPMTFADETVIDKDVIELLPRSLAREEKVFPIGESDAALVLAVCDPDNVEAFDKLQFVLNRRIAIVLTSENWIAEQISVHYDQH